MLDFQYQTAWEDDFTQNIYAPKNGFFGIK